jgi:hypothetical protein
MQASVHPSVSEALSKPTVTAREKQSITQAADALQTQLNGCPFFGSLRVALVPSAEDHERDSTLPGFDALRGVQES